MILTGPEIIKAVGAGDIEISPFDVNSVGPNSVDLRLGDELKVYLTKRGKLFDEVWQQAKKSIRIEEYLESAGAILDVRHPCPTQTISIPEDGLVLMPGAGYLGRTVEVVGTDKYVPRLAGRSSIGRSFISVHHTAGLGDLGFTGTWTLEITCVHPVRIYPGMRICQLTFEEVVGETILYRERDGSKYHGQEDPKASLGYEDFT